MLTLTDHLATVIEEPMWTFGGGTVLMPAGEIDIVVGTPLTDRPWEVVAYRGRRILVETNAEILAKKMYHRRNEAKARDLFDLCAVADLDPGAIDQAAPFFKRHGDAFVAQLKANVGYLEKDFAQIHRINYREILFTADGIERTLGGVILFDETLRQSARDGVPFPTLLARRGIIPGIKVDQGAKALALHPGNRVTEGLDGLRERLAQYRQLGAQFAKWRAVIEIDERDIPSPFGIRANAHAPLGHYCPRSEPSYPLDPRHKD